MINKDNLISYQSKIFDYVIFFSYFLYIAIFLGIFSNAPKYLKSLSINPLNNSDFNKFDKKIIYNTAIYLLTTTVLTDFTISYLNQIQTYIKTNVPFLHNLLPVKATTPTVDPNAPIDHNAPIDPNAPVFKHIPPPTNSSDSSSAK